MKKAIRIGIAIICMVTLIVGYYAYLSRRNDSASAETNVELSEVQAITSKNFAKEYPATPRAVVKWYNRIISAYYAEDYTQEELEKMAEQARMLMDDELLASNENFEGSIRIEVTSRKAQQYSIPAYVVQTKEPEEIMVDGRKMCSVDCLFNVRNATTPTYSNYYTFILRRDQTTGNWKILGWTLKEEE